MYLFLGNVTTTQHRWGGIKQQKFTLLQFRRPAFWSQIFSNADSIWKPREVICAIFLSLFSNARWLLAFLVFLGLSIPPFTPYIYFYIAFSVFLCSLLLFQGHKSIFRAYPCGSGGKELPAMLETWVQSLGWEDPLEKGKATHASILAWRIPWTMQSMGSQRVRHNWAPFTFTLNLGESHL